MFGQRAFPFGRIDLEAVRRARATKLTQSQQRRGVGIQVAWEQRGPLNIQGRVTSLAVDPRDDDFCYIGAAEGGVWKTTDGGASFTPLYDHQPAISIGALALNPSNPDVVFAGTGEVNPGRGSVAYGGDGIYRSDDQGLTWQNIGLENSGSIGRIVVHPTNPDIIHVAVMGHLWNPGSDRGVYRTTNGGATWSKVLYLDDITGCVDLIQRPDDPDVLLASMWTRIRGPEDWDYGSEQCAVYRSEDGGLTWAVEGNGLPVSTVDSGRIGISLCESNPDVMVAIYSSGVDEGRWPIL